MGTQTTPSPPSPDGGGFSVAAAATATDDQTYSFPQDGWVDAIYVYAGAYSGTVTLTATLYRTDTGGLIATSEGVGGQPVGHGWVRCPLASTIHLPQGYGWSVGIYGSPNLQCGNHTGVGNYWVLEGGSPATSRESGVENKEGFAGQLYYYLSYYPTCTISSVDPGPVAPGQTFHVHGQSFSAGVSRVTLGGTVCPTYSVDSDSQLTVTVPDGATTGTVTVTTQAGTATSSGTVTVSSVHVFRGGTWVSASQTAAWRTSAWATADGVDAWRTNTWHPGD